jgi:Double zinc ribbon
MQCPRCQHENRPQATFCEACGTPLSANPTGPPGPSYAEITSALSAALEQQTATAELQQARTRELAEAHEQQAATAEILRVISSSPTDVQPVFAAVLTSAARLCDALDASIFQLDGDQLRLVAHEGPIPTIPLGEFPLRGTSVGRAVLDRRTIYVADLQAEVDDYPEASAFARSLGHRTTLTVRRVERWRAHGRVRWHIHGFRRGPQSGSPDDVSSALPNTTQRYLKFCYSGRPSACSGAGRRGGAGDGARRPRTRRNWPHAWERWRVG